MSDKGRQIADGRPGDKYTLPVGYQGNWGNAVGVPQGSSHGPSVPLPAGTVNAGITTVERPDFRKVPKNAQVFPK